MKVFNSGALFLRETSVHRSVWRNTVSKMLESSLTSTKRSSPSSETIPISGTSEGNVALVVPVTYSFADLDVQKRSKFSEYSARIAAVGLMESERKSNG
jgi:hypothetical protein